MVLCISSHNLSPFTCLIFSDEVPQGLQLIANGVGHTLLLNDGKEVQKRVMISSIFRLVVGYLFLSSLFINIAQNDDVLSIFYDVLALEFVESIDDTAFALGKYISISVHICKPINHHVLSQVLISAHRPHKYSQKRFLWKTNVGCNKPGL